MEERIITKEKCEKAILELSREPDKTFIYLSTLKRIMKEETIEFIKNESIKKDSKKYCANCKNRGRGVEAIGSDDNMHCEKYNAFCIENNHQLWEEDK